MNFGSLNSLNNLRCGDIAPFNPRSISGLKLLVDSSAGTTYADSAVQFTASDKARLQVADNATIETGDIDFELGGWVWIDTNVSGGVMGKWGTASNNEYLIYYESSSAQLKFYVTTDGTTSTSVTSTPALSTAGWYFVRAWHDHTLNKIYIQVGNGTIYNADWSTGVKVGTSALLFGATLTAGQYLNGRLDSMYFSKTISSTTEATALYNGNVGQDSIQVQANPLLTTWWTNVISFWDMNSDNGIRNDKKGTNHLQQTFVNIIDPSPTTPILNGGFESQGTGETLGTEKVTNGAFASDTGWTHGADVVIAAGVATMTASGAGALSQAASISTTATRYKISLDITAITGTLQFRFGGIAGTTDTQFTTTGTKTFYMTSAAAADGTIILEAPSGTVTAVIDNVSVKQVTASNTFLNWTGTTTGSSTINAGTVSPYAGTYNARFDIDSASSDVYLTQQLITKTHKYKMSCYAKANSGTPGLFLGDTSGGGVGITLTTNYPSVGSPYTAYWTALDTKVILERSGSSASKSIFIDDVTLICTEIPSAAGIAAGLAIDGNLCQDFNGTTQYDTVASNASLQLGGNSSAIFAWFNTSNPIPYQNILSKQKDSTNREYRIQLAAGSLLFGVFANGQGAGTFVTSPTTILANTWYQVICWLDNSGNTINISVNNETPASQAYSSGIYNGTASFMIGNNQESVAYFNGRIDSVGIIKRLLTAGERTALFNLGKGVKYAGLPSSISTDALLVAFYNLDEYSAGTSNVTRLDSTSNHNDLTASGNPPSAQGVNYFEGTISKWVDKSGQANNLIQTTQSARLLYVTGAQNGKPVLRGDGLTKSIYNATDLIGTGDVTVFAVIKPRGWGGGGFGRIIDNSNLVFRVDTSGCLKDGSGAASAASSITLNTAYVVAVTRTSAGVVNFYINGTLSGSADQASGTPAAGTPTYIGNNAAGTRGFDGDLDAIFIAQKIMSASEIANLTRYYKIKFGI